VGKLTDQALDSFINELDKVSKESNEGEAQRYFDHALILKSTIQFLRNNNDIKLFSGFKQQPPAAAVESTTPTDTTETTTANSRPQPIEDEPVSMDLLRCESLASLDEDSRQRILAKNYSLLVSMAPYSSSGEAANSPPVTADAPYHLGPAIPEVNSVWFRLFLYELIGDGPASLFLPKGHRLARLPDSFTCYDKFMVITWGHDPIISSHFNLLLTLNDALSHGPILVQAYAESEDAGGLMVNVAFNDHTHPLFKHPSVQRLHEQLGLTHFIGYVTMLNTCRSSSSAMEESTEAVLTELVDFEEWTFLELRYGVPLFDRGLNTKILGQIRDGQLGCYENLSRMLELSRKLSLELIDFVQRHQLIDIVDKSFMNSAAGSSSTTGRFASTSSYNISGGNGATAAATTSAVINSNNFNNHLFSDVNSYLIAMYNNSKSIKRSSQSNVVLYPTQCVLFESGVGVRVENF
jgi:hypothetical protein